MPLAFRQWHLYRFDFMVPVVGLEPTRISPHDFELFKPFGT